jgi:hypothetical protein
MPINFPDSPTTGDIFTSGGTSWSWDGSKWNLYLGSNLVTTSELSSALSAYAPNSNPSVTNATLGDTTTINGTATFINKPVIPGYQDVSYSSEPPITPSVGQTWISTNNWTLSIRDVSNTWKLIPAVSSYGSSAPATPATGQTYINSSNNTMQVYTGSSWVNVGASINLAAYAGNINPSVTNTYDLGTTSLRWRNIYTQDLNLSNGIGDYTIVEGEDDLFIINNKSGKYYKFMLSEVDPSEVPPKSES